MDGEQQNWSQVLPVYLKLPWALLVREHDERKSQSPKKTIRTQTSAHGNKDWARLSRPSSETSQRSWTHRFSNTRRPRWASVQVVGSLRYWEFHSCVHRLIWCQSEQRQTGVGLSQIEAVNAACNRVSFLNTHARKHTHSHTPSPVIPEHLGTCTNTQQATYGTKNQHETRPVWRGLLSVTQQPLLWWVRLIDGGSTCWPLVRRQDPCSVSTTLKSSGHISWSQIKKVKSDPWVNLCPTCDQETEQISAGSVTIFLRSYASSDKWTRECETATETNLNLTTTVVKTMSFNQHKRRILDRKPSIVSSRQLKLHVCKGSWEQETSHPETHTDRLRIRSAKIHQRPRLHSGNDIIIRTSQLNNVLFLFFTFNLLPYFSLTGAASPPQEVSTETRNCLLL